MIWIASRQSTCSWSCSVTSVPYQPTLDTELEQRLLQRLSSAMQTTHHRTDRNLEDVGDLLVGETFDIGEEHGDAELLGQGFEGALHVFLRAAEAIRVKVVMERFKLTDEAARRRLKQSDENWTAYIKQVYGHDRNLASHYDMVLDTGRLGYEATVEAILAALNNRKPLT